MSLVDRAALSRCAVVLAAGAWGLLILVIGGLLFLLMHLGDPPTISAGTIEAGSSPASGLAIGSTLAGHAATVIGMGIGLFVVIAIGSSLSGAALAAARRARRHGDRSITVTVAMLSATIYLAAVGGVLIRVIA